MVSQDADNKKAPPPFRFLKAEEYAALPNEERVKYLHDAIEALRSGRPVDIPSDRARQH